MSAGLPTPTVQTEAKPLLRGWLHAVCFFLAVPVGLWVVLRAGSAGARVSAIFYAVGLIALFGVSGAYHRLRWGPIWKRRMQRLDHATIFVMIAGSYTPVCLLVLKGWLAVVMLVAAWAGAVAGAVLAWTSGRRTRVVRSALYIVLGWAAVFSAPQLFAHLALTQLLLIAIGGVLFTVGAITLMTHWPDPFPRVFGYHEVWHALVVVAVVCQLAAINSIVGGAGVA